MIRVVFIFAGTASAFLSPHSNYRLSTAERHTFAHHAALSYLSYLDGRQTEEVTSMTIPVLGPMPTALPVLPGAEMVLNPPTPMQFLALEEAIELQKVHLKTGDQAGIDSAPIVAILDEYTGETTKEGRYATIAAVVGVSSRPSQRLEDFDPWAYVESVRSMSTRSTSQGEGRIRLVGIGRAQLKNFVYTVPAHVRTSMDEEGHILDEDDEDYIDPSPNIVMAQFKLLHDGSQRSDSFQKSCGGRSAHASPVHALNEMGSLASKIHFMHEDRRKLVAGLKAAKARLESTEQELDELEDHDGIGMLFAKKAMPQNEYSQEVLDQFMADFAPKRNRKVSSRASPLLEMDNYGMGQSSSSISTIPHLTSAWVEKLTPYYSPSRITSEEFYYETLSFVSVLALDKFLQPNHLGWTLKCTNTIERMQQAYEWMFSHVQLLREEAEKVSQELLQCGEECTDLF